jgi:PAS domain S-box-containing protein
VTEDSSLLASHVDARTFAAALAETTESLVCVLDAEARILVFNEACERATGYRADEVLGQDARDFVIPPDEAAAFGEMLAAIWRTASPSPQVGHWLTREGKRRLIAWSNKPVLGEDGVPAYLVTSGHDITEHERVAAERHALAGDLEARLADIGRLAQEQSALRRVATLVASEPSPEQVFDAVSKQCARVLDTGAAAVFKFEGDSATIVGRYDREYLSPFQLGSSIPLDPNSAVGRVHQTGEPVRIDDYSELPGEVAEIMRETGLKSTVAAPIFVAGRLWGAVAVTSLDADGLAPEGQARLRDFCELVSLAVASADARKELRASRARIVQAADEERRRLERNLHDGAQQRLVSLALALRLARAQLATNPDGATTLLEDAAAELVNALEELRELARGLHPGLLTEHGLPAALQALVERAPFETTVTVPHERLPPAIETTTYYIVSEALANAAKHAQAKQAAVAVRLEDEGVVVEVRDDGRGGADAAGGSGIVGLSDRAEAVGGTLTIDSPPGAGTLVRAVLPLAG